MEFRNWLGRGQIRKCDHQANFLYHSVCTTKLSSSFVSYVLFGMNYGFVGCTNEDYLCMHVSYRIKNYDYIVFACSRVVAYLAIFTNYRYNFFGISHKHTYG